MKLLRSMSISWIFSASLLSIVAADEFRLISEIHVNGSTTPTESHLTLFSERLICDFLMSDEIQAQPREVIIFDSHQRRFALLDMQRKVRTEISDLQLDKLVDTLARETQLNDASKFLLTESFTEETNWAEHTVKLVGSNITYQFVGEQPKEVVILPRYFEFLDNFTKLNATDPKNFSPFPRMKLNQKIKQLGWCPVEVRVSIQKNDFFRTDLEAISKHNLTIGLTSRDRELMAAAKRDWVQFRSVELREYREVGGNRQVQTENPEEKNLDAKKR